MATTTTKLALSKPDGTDLVDIAVLNANADKIDAASGATICTSTTRPASPWNGQVIFETDTLNALVYRSSTSSWTTIGGSTVSTTPPSTAGSGNLWWDSDNGKLYIYYADANSSQWVAVIPGSGANQAATNVVLNSDFSINQRAFTSSTANGNYGFDRWISFATAGATFSAQTFTPGSGPVAGVESINYHRTVTTGQSGVGVYTFTSQRIEEVRTLAGKTITVSFYAKAASGTPKLAVEFAQNFGTGGSANVTTYAGQVTLSTSWARYSVTVAVPSLSGKTVGAGSYTELAVWCSAGTDWNARTGSLGIQSNTFDFWGVQVEENPQATAYKRNQPNLQAELAACQRYYKRWNVFNNGYVYMGGGGNVNTTTAQFDLQHQMRIGPTTVDFVNSQIYRYAGISVSGTASIYAATETNTIVRFACPGGSFTATPELMGLVGSTGGYIALSAEL